MIVLTQSTIVTMFGPSKALKGDSSDAVKDASENMRQQQWMVLFIGTISYSLFSLFYHHDLILFNRALTLGAICITCLFSGACIQTWVNLPYPLAIIASFIYIVSYTLLILWGRGAYFMFHLETDITTPGV